MNHKNIINKGFSLVELLVVISIIGVLTIIVLPNFMGAREKARDSQRIQDLSSIKTALRVYYNDHQAYPTGVGTSGVPGSPLDPTEFSSYFPSIAGLGFTYGYADINSGDGFVLCLNLEARGGSEAVNSQGKCNIPNLGISFCRQGIGVTGSGVYTICAN